jgi:hypothetical protein
MTALDFPPRLLPAPAAARYLGVSESLLRMLPIPQYQPPARFLNNSRPIVTQELSRRIVQDLGESDDRD